MQQIQRKGFVVLSFVLFLSILLISSSFQQENVEETISECDYYAVLNLPHSATIEEINQQKLDESSSNETLKAFEILSSPLRKLIYDNSFQIAIYLKKEFNFQDQDLKFFINLLVENEIALVVIVIVLLIVGILLIFLFGLIIWALCVSRNGKQETNLENTKLLEKDKID